MDKNKEFYFKWGMVAVGILFFAWVVAPIIMLALGGLIGSIVALAIGAVAYAFLPVAALQLTIWKFKAHKAIVSKAPIEALYLRLKERRENREAIRKKLETQTTFLAGFRRDRKSVV